MNTKTKSLRMGKSDLLESVKPMSEKEFRSTINLIISNNRDISLIDAKKMRIVQHIEVLMFLAKIGEDIMNFSLETTNKEKCAA